MWNPTSSDTYDLLAIRETIPCPTGAAALLLPCLGWVSFATVLNVEIRRRNPRT
jgi:tryptophan-rich sensory protein